MFIESHILSLNLRFMVKRELPSGLLADDPLGLEAG
jgi:hypothetical protein